MTILCTLKRSPFDTCQQAEYEIIHRTPTLVSVRLAHPSWTDSATIISVSCKEIDREWEVSPVLPEAEVSEHTWHETCDKEYSWGALASLI